MLSEMNGCVSIIYFLGIFYGIEAFFDYNKCEKCDRCVCLHSEPNLLVRACNQLGQFLQHRETNLRYLALESMCTLASSEFSHEAVKTHIETVINALKVSVHTVYVLLMEELSCLSEFRLTFS